MKVRHINIISNMEVIRPQRTHQRRGNGIMAKVTKTMNTVGQTIPPLGKCNLLKSSSNWKPSKAKVKMKKKKLNK